MFIFLLIYASVISLGLIIVAYSLIGTKRQLKEEIRKNVECLGQLTYIEAQYEGYRHKSLAQARMIEELQIELDVAYSNLLMTLDELERVAPTTQTGIHQSI